MKRWGLIIALVGVAAVIIWLGVAWWATSQTPKTSQQSGAVNDLLQQRQDHVCGLPAASSVAAATQVVVSDAGFQPQTVTVKLGQVVQWVGEGGQDHQVVSDPPPVHTDCLGLNSPMLHQGDTFSFAFTKSGTWSYYDQQNPGMTGKVVVGE